MKTDTKQSARGTTDLSSTYLELMICRADGTLSFRYYHSTG